MGVRREVLALTTAADGSVSGTINLKGYIGGIRVQGFDGAADVAITAPVARPILTKTGVDADETYYPRTPVHAAADGSVITGGYSPVLLCGDTVTVAVTNGGNAQTGSVTFDMVD